MLTDTTVTGRDVTTVLSGVAQTGRHLVVVMKRSLVEEKGISSVGGFGFWVGC